MEIMATAKVLNGVSDGYTIWIRTDRYVGEKIIQELMRIPEIEILDPYNKLGGKKWLNV